MPPTIQMVRLSVSPSLKSSAPGRHRAHAHFLGERGRLSRFIPSSGANVLQQLNAGFALFGHLG